MKYPRTWKWQYKNLGNQQTTQLTTGQSLLCYTFNLLERIILNRITPLIEEQTPVEQAGFRRRRNTTEYVLPVTI